MVGLVEADHLSVLGQPGQQAGPEILLQLLHRREVMVALAIFQAAATEAQPVGLAGVAQVPLVLPVRQALEGPVVQGLTRLLLEQLLRMQVVAVALLT